MLAPALLVTVVLVRAIMPASVAPSMLPELTTWAKPSWTEIPLKPPVMLAPALLVTVALSPARTATPLVPVMWPELVTSALPTMA